MRRPNSIVIGCGILLIGVLIFFLYYNAHHSVQSEKKVILPDLTFQDYAGNPFSLSDFSSKPVVLILWASWCPTCSGTLKDLAAIQKELGSDAVTIAAVNRSETRAIAQQYSDAIGGTHSIIFLLDPHDELYSALEGFSMPEILFINAHGNIQSRSHGIMPPEELRRHIQDIL